jgi:RNA polymerase sigma factor (sigma-70 family)
MERPFRSDFRSKPGGVGMNVAVACRSRRIDEQTLHEALLARINSLRNYVASKTPPRLRHIISPDDILQEVWIAAYRTISTFEANGPNPLDRWLTTIANSKLVDALRAARRLKRGGNRRLVRNAEAPLTSFSDLFAELRSPQQTPSSEFHAVEAAHAVLISLNRLNDSRRQAIEMRFIEGLSHKEIACKMGKSGAAVNSLLFHGLRQLRAMLGDAAKYFSDACSSDSSRVGE